MEKVACLIYPNFSIYEIATLTSSLVLNFGVTVDYIASRPESVLSEDGLSCQPTKLISEVNLDDYSCLLLPGMINFIPALEDKLLIDFLSSLKGKDTLIAAISSAPILLAKAGLLIDREFTGGIWQNFFDYFKFLPKENFKPKTVHQDENVITAIGFAHQEFARKVLMNLGLTSDASNYFVERKIFQRAIYCLGCLMRNLNSLKNTWSNSIGKVTDCDSRSCPKMKPLYRKEMNAGYGLCKKDRFF